MKFKKNIDASGVKPIHPHNIRQHGLLGIPFFTQHWFIDDNWTPLSIGDEFSKMADLLRKRLEFTTIEHETSRRSLFKKFRTLKYHCRLGRKKLKYLIQDGSREEVRKALTNYKGMQRLYKRMSIYQVVDSIDQRTFVMRKERDRLFVRQEQLQKTYAEKMFLRDDLEARIKYQNDYILDEEVKACQIEKLLSNLNARLAALTTINTTYKKLIQILSQDAIFYEPILSSLDHDIKDQENFIKHILHLGTPALLRFKQLSEDYRIQLDRAQKRSQNIIRTINTMQSTTRKLSDGIMSPSKVHDPQSHFVRQTSSMLNLKHQLQDIESVIKTIQDETFCSTAKEICSRIRYQGTNNYHLRKIIEKDDLGYEALESKMKWSSVLRTVLTNNLAEEEIRRVKHIESLKSDIKHEDEMQACLLNYLKFRAETLVLLRYSLWSIHNIMRHVAPVRAQYSKYQTSYLNLPLLRFEMLNNCAVPPDPYEENVSTLMHIAEKKLKILLEAYSDLKAINILENRVAYENEFIANMKQNNQMNKNENIIKETILKSPAELEHTFNVMSFVPGREQIKANSNKIVEKYLKINE